MSISSSTTMDSKWNNLHRLVCSGCAQLGVRIDSSVIADRLPGFAICTCLHCSFPKVWIVCSVCPSTNLRFEMSYNLSRKCLTFNNYAQFKNHLKGGKHSNVPSPYQREIDFGSVQDKFPQLHHNPANICAPTPSAQEHFPSKRQRVGVPEEEMEKCHKIDEKQHLLAADYPIFTGVTDGGEVMPSSIEKVMEDYHFCDDFKDIMAQVAVDFPNLQISEECLEALFNAGELETFWIYLHNQEELYQAHQNGAGAHQDSRPPRQPLRYLPPTVIEQHTDFAQFGRLATKEFLFYASQGWGVEYLVAKANYGKLWTRANITARDIENFLEAIFLYQKLPHEDHKHAIKVFNHANYGHSLPPILHHRDFRRIVYDGKYSFMQNLPFPAPVKITHPSGKEIDTFAYIPIQESLALMCLLGTEHLDVIEEDQDRTEWAMQLSRSNYAQAMYDPSADIHLLLVTWQDGFSPNRTKKERNSTWVKTATLTTIGKGKGGPYHSKYGTTILVGVGSSKGDKRFIERRFFEDIAKVNKPGGVKFFNLPEKKQITVRVSIIAALGDQPERRDFCGYAGNAKHLYGKALGITGVWKSVYHNIPSCDACLGVLLHQKRVVKNCAVCLNWDVLRDSEMTRFPVHKDYPKTNADDPALAKFRKVDCPEIRQAVAKARLHTFSGEWKANQATEYLKSHGLNTETAKGVSNSATWMGLWARRHGLDPDSVNILEECRRKHPEYFEEYVLPPFLTSGLSMDQVIPVLMHLLFLGLVKTLHGLIEDWLAKEEKSASFTAMSKGILEELSCLKIDWCKPQPFSKNDKGHGIGGTGWMAEDFLSYSRIMNWLYQPLDKIGVVPAMEQFPDYNTDDLNCWTKAQCEKWLKLHKKNAGGDANVVKARVRHYHTRAEGPPKFVPNKPTAKQTQKLIQSLIAIVTRLMARVIDNEFIDETHCHILIFLSFFHRWDAEMQFGKCGYVDPKAIPGWLSKNNFLDLPFVCEYMRRFGPLVQFWDGRHEKFITYMRKYCSRGHRVGAQMDSARRFQQSQSLDWIKSFLNPLSPIALEAAPQFGSKFRYHPYRKSSDIEKAYTQCKPLSGFLNKNGEYCICLL